MKHWLNQNFKTLIIAAFLIPIITVAIVSISHVTKWYGISNPVSWAVYLSIGIEIAALSALAAISANMGKKVYFPFAVVTLIQFIGNVFFAYTYIDINGQSFRDWVDLVLPLTELMGVDPTDLVGNKRFLAFFAGGMLPIISLSFLHMLVKFTEEDRLKENQTPPIKELESNPEDLKHFVDESVRLHLSENDLKKLEEVLLNPPPPNEELKKAEEEYKRRGELLAEIMKNDEEMGLYDEPFDNPMIKEDLDDEVSDWDETLMDGLEDEEPFFTEEEIENILQEEPTEEEVQRNFSTIEPETENIFQDNETLEFDILVQEDLEVPEQEFDGFVPEPFATPEEVVELKIDENNERMDIIGQNGNEGLHYENEENTSSEQDDEKKKLEEFLTPILEELKEDLVSLTIENIPPQEQIQTLELTDSKEETLYWESDDTNPNQVIYDLENNKTIIPTSEEEINTLPQGEKVISRNVSSRRRNFR
jgi:hypothetical protein